MLFDEPAALESYIMKNKDKYELLPSFLPAFLPSFLPSFLLSLVPSLTPSFTPPHSHASPSLSLSPHFFLLSLAPPCFSFHLSHSLTPPLPSLTPPLSHSSLLSFPQGSTEVVGSVPGEYGGDGDGAAVLRGGA